MLRGCGSYRQYASVQRVVDGFKVCVVFERHLFVLRGICSLSGNQVDDNGAIALAATLSLNVTLHVRNLVSPPFVSP